MDFFKIPIGFGMALAMNRASNARSEKEMHGIVNSLAAK